MKFGTIAIIATSIWLILFIFFIYINFFTKEAKEYWNR